MFCHSCQGISLRYWNPYNLVFRVVVLTTTCGTLLQSRLELGGPSAIILKNGLGQICSVPLDGRLFGPGLRNHCGACMVYRAYASSSSLFVIDHGSLAET